MTKGRATETQLGELHNKVATIMSNALDVVEASQEVYLAQAKDAMADPDNLGLLPERPPEVPATLLSVMTKFLADNKITCVPEEQGKSNALAEKLAANRERRRVGNVVHMVDPE